jgi:hypothetical protein
MATMADLDELALSLPHTTKDLSDDGRPSYLVHGKVFCFHRSQRRDAINPQTGDRLDDVLTFRVADHDVKELLLAEIAAWYQIAEARFSFGYWKVAKPRPQATP